MKRILPVILLLAVIIVSAGSVRAQEEYFKLDTAGKQPVQKKEDTQRRSISDDGDFSSLPLADRIRLGGSFGIRFGTFTNVNLSPAAGLEVVKNLTLGLGASYIYMRNPDYFIPSGSANFYGARTFLFYSPIPMLHLQAEYELMNVEFYNHGSGRFQGNTKTFARTWLSSPMLGAGYSQPIGGRFTRGVHMTLLYNFNYQNHINPSINYDFYSPATQVKNISHYASPFVFRILLF